MKARLRILGFYKRIRDNNEFILFEKNNELFLTNGVYIWRNQFKRIEERYLKELKEVKEIDLRKISQRLTKYFQHAEITKEVNDLLENLKCEKQEMTL